MENAASIKSFLFGFAQYVVNDGQGDEVVLRVNYAKNSFRIISKTTKKNTLFRQELADFAESLLKRKHNTNFAQKNAS